MNGSLQLSSHDQMCLTGDLGPVKRFAMELLVRVARNTGAKRLLDISQAHLVGSYHSGAGNLQLLRWFAEQSAKVVVPTTLNASSEDLLQPATVDADFQSTLQVVTYYQRMGCQVSLTCAPYHLPSVPAFGDNIAWAESNAVVYANSVLGARTNMAVQYLDLCAALTGRMPEFGLYLDENRRGQWVFDLSKLPGRWLSDDGFFQLLGFHIGRVVGQKIPVVVGLEAITDDQLRALGAAAAASGAVNMVHVVGHTPEAPTLDAACGGLAPDTVQTVLPEQILAARAALGGDLQDEPDSICLGTPHFSLTEFDRLIDLMAGRRVLPEKSLVVTTSRYNLSQLGQRAHRLSEAGVTLVADRCCYYPRKHALLGQSVMTNAAKWAYYGPGNLNVKSRFARLETCVAIATGQVTDEEVFWRE